MERTFMAAELKPFQFGRLIAEDMQDKNAEQQGKTHPGA
jgi:hypothetical protein